MDSDQARGVLLGLACGDAAGRTCVIGRELGDELSVSAQKISYHIGKLEEKGLVETHPDGRQKNIELSDVGRLYLRWTGGQADVYSRIPIN